MKVLVCGGRDYDKRERIGDFLDARLGRSATRRCSMTRSLIWWSRFQAGAGLPTWWSALVKPACASSLRHSMSETMGVALAVQSQLRFLTRARTRQARFPPSS